MIDPKEVSKMVDEIMSNIFELETALGPYNDENPFFHLRRKAFLARHSLNELQHWYRKAVEARRKEP